MRLNTPCLVFLLILYPLGITCSDPIRTEIAFQGVFFCITTASYLYPTLVHSTATSITVPDQAIVLFIELHYFSKASATFK